jgi:hypothetical protein
MKRFHWARGKIPERARRVLYAYGIGKGHSHDEHGGVAGDVMRAI